MKTILSPLFVTLFWSTMFLNYVSASASDNRDSIFVKIESDFSYATYENQLTDSVLIERNKELWLNKKEELINLFTAQLRKDFNKYCPNKWHISSSCEHPSFVILIKVLYLDLDGELTAEISIDQIEDGHRHTISLYCYELDDKKESNSYISLRGKCFEKLALKLVEKQSQVFYPYPHNNQSVIKNTNRNYCADLNSSKKWRPELRFGLENVFSSYMERIKTDEPIKNIELILGNQKNRHLNIGYGIGFSKYEESKIEESKRRHNFNRMSKIKYTPTTYFPLFMQAKFNILNKRFTPYLLGRIGGVITDARGIGLLASAGIGISYRCINGRLFTDYNGKAQVIHCKEYGYDQAHILSTQWSIGYVYVPRWKK